jgi:hypothetical protein
MLKLTTFSTSVRFSREELSRNVCSLGHFPHPDKTAKTIPAIDTIRIFGFTPFGSALPEKKGLPIPEQTP